MRATGRSPAARQRALDIVSSLGRLDRERDLQQAQEADGEDEEEEVEGKEGMKQEADEEEEGEGLARA